MKCEYMVVLCSCPDEALAARLARIVVEEQLAACVNVLSGLRSVYRWQGAVHDEPEVLLLIKTRHERYEALEMRIRALHPYEVPEIIALPIIAGSASYLGWLAAACAGRAESGNPGKQRSSD
jgi:periplasmic divalent cation tolerance protein